NEQAIVVTDPPTKNDQNPSLVNLDSLLKICTAVEYREMEGKIKYYKLKFDNTPFFEYNAIDIYINSETNFLSKIILYFRAEVDLDEDDKTTTKDRPRIEISYSGISLDPVFSAGQFSESKYIRISSKKIICAPSYNSFRLVNNKIQ